ncbi:hypothetical protein ASG75_09195 [Rhodanobacter sp. Soil772]|nr:hypothetical protein ASG75_09195 [Rhodanobacter sp. Soil772]
MTSLALFPDLLGDDAWRSLPAAVQAMHGAAPMLRAHGLADVVGADHFMARCLRRQRFGQSGRGHVECGQLYRRIAQAFAQRRQAGQLPAGKRQAKARIAGQLAGNARTEYAAGTDQQYAQAHPLPQPSNSLKNKNPPSGGFCWRMCFRCDVRQLRRCSP